MKFFTILPALVVVAAALPTNNVVKQEKELLADILEQYLGLAQTYHGMVDILKCHFSTILLLQ